MTDRATPTSTDDGSAHKVVRLDRWLWAARFFKTRALAKRAIETGRVEVGGARAKPAKDIAPGAELTIRRGDDSFDIVVRALSEQRGPAKTARTLYEETPESIEAREIARSERRMARAGLKIPAHRPDKRARRDLRQLRHRTEGSAPADNLPGDPERDPGTDR